MSKKKTKFNDVISAINELTDSQQIDIYVPSLGRNVKFKPLTVYHQKKIIESAIDTSAYNTASGLLLSSQIIKECCTEKDIKLYAIDRDPVLISLRAKTLGYDVPVQDPNGDVKVFNIEEHVSSFNNIQPEPDMFTNKQHEQDGIQFVTRVPTLKQDDIVSNKVLPGVKRNSEDTGRLKEIISDAISHEYIKYIHSISINGNTIEFNCEDVLDLVHVVGALPMTVSKKLVDEINKIKGFERKFTQINTDTEILTLVTDARFYHSE